MRFGLACVEQVSVNLGTEASIEALGKFRSLMADFGPDAQPGFQALASKMSIHASQHPGSKSLHGTCHAAVSATYALAKALSGQPVEAEAYAAYSTVYGYGGYAVSDSASFAEVHRKQPELLNSIKRGPRLVGNCLESSRITPKCFDSDPHQSPNQRSQGDSESVFQLEYSMVRKSFVPESLIQYRRLQPALLWARADDTLGLVEFDYQSIERNTFVNVGHDRGLGGGESIPKIYTSSRPQR
jgi:hypothetical protein